MPRSSRYRWPYAGGIIDVAWATFSVANLIAIVAYPEWETVPFHFIWVSLTIVYGFRVWSLGAMWVVLSVVCLTTGLFIARDIYLGDQPPDEFTEVPLMAAMFLAMVWHARRRLAMMRSLEEVSEYNLRLLEQQRQFVANASHELRTPITIALGHAELIADALEAGTTSDDAHVVMDELDRLRRLSDRLLALAAPDGQDFLNWSVVDVQSLIIGIAQRWLPTDRDWSVAASGEAHVMGDSDRLTLAVDALIENAVSNTAPGEAIRLSVSTSDDTVAIGVSDTGRGIAAPDLDRIFDRSIHLDSGQRRGSASRGLGLSIVQAVAKAHAGHVTVTSQLGLGACFTLVLPTADGSRSKAIERPVVGAARDATGTPG
ncbi:MAG: two-component system, OmpR family, sensor kinase [Nocardioidaceae bacterium]|nr:two-component system, OmpR family, sensor kinase [Nocardioidaceae bacterium]